MSSTIEKPAVYEQRSIVFLDFLGFKDIVAETTAEPDRLSLLLEAMNLLSSLEPYEADVDKQVTQFSDSVVVSFPVTKTSSVFHLVNEVALLVLELIYLGFLVRGAITFGRLIHTDKILVGPAMVQAYEMESKEAVIPRVVSDPQKIIPFAIKYHASQNSPSEEAEYVRSLITQDKDGMFFLDYVSWHSVVIEACGQADEYNTYLATIGRLVKKGLQYRDDRVEPKYLWLHKRYVASI